MTRRVPIAVGEWYHCYNRGVDRRVVFQDTRDYERFLLLCYLSNGMKSLVPSNLRNASLARALQSEHMLQTKPLIEIGAYCLMPNHVHFIVKENTEGGLATFMQKVFTGYTMYFNQRNDRAGALFGGTYKSSHLSSDRYFKHAINYVHMNPIELWEPNWKTGAGNLGVIEEKLRGYAYSSLQEHTGSARPERKILGDEVFTLFDSPTSLSTMLFEAQAYHRGVDTF